MKAPTLLRRHARRLRRPASDHTDAYDLVHEPDRVPDGKRR